MRENESKKSAFRADTGRPKTMTRRASSPIVTEDPTTVNPEPETIRRWIQHAQENPELATPEELAAWKRGLERSVECVGRPIPAGWATFPLEGKRPLCRWRDESRPGHVRPGCNVGLDCGKTGLVVLDLDVKNGVDGVGAYHELRERLGFDDSGALVSRTPSGGMHYIWAAPTGEIGNSTRNLPAGIDVRGNGGYIVIPPSRGYKWLRNGGEPAPLPTELAELLTREPEVEPIRQTTTTTPNLNIPEHEGGRAERYALAALEAEAAELAGTPPGGRNEALNTAAYNLGQLVAGCNLARDLVEAALLDAATANGLMRDDGERGVRATLKSGLEAGMTQARSVPTVSTPREASEGERHRTDVGNAARFAEDHAVATSFLTDDQVIAKATDATNGDKFERLWAGDWQGYDSQSEADQALCSLLAFWTQDPAQIDRLFRQSGLMRDKWKREDYSGSTITLALSGGEFYTPGRSPIRPEHGTEIPLDGAVEDISTHLTCAGNAARLAKRYAGRLCYVEAWGWLVWTGKRWQIDHTGAGTRAATETVQGIRREAAETAEQAEKVAAQIEHAKRTGDTVLASILEAQQEKLRQEAKALLSHANKSEDKYQLQSMLELAKADKALVARPEWFDANPWLLNVENGTLDLRTLELREHDPRDRITKLAPVEWDPRATCPQWDRFLEDVFLGDEELIEFVKRRVGYSLTGDVREQEFALLYGFGSNGKSTLINILLSILGDYAVTTPVETLLEKRVSAASNDVAALAGARFVVASELPERATLRESLVKDLTGGDRITARFLYKEFFSFSPTFKLWMYGNHKPRVRGTDDAIWRRVNLIPFGARFVEADEWKRQNGDGEQLALGEELDQAKGTFLADPTIVKRLEAEQAGILRWAVEGCQRWLKDGLSKPATVRAASAAYRSEQDVLGSFLAECCEEGINLKAYTSDLYRAYERWTGISGEYALSKRRMGQKLRERGFWKDRGTDNKQQYNGVALSDYGLRLAMGPDGGG